MPWHKKAMKDVTTDDMLRGGGNNLISADFRMGQPDLGNARSSTSEYIGCVKPTQGTETSKYLEEEKIIMIS
jgi:hypothetical protein